MTGRLRITLSLVAAMMVTGMMGGCNDRMKTDNARLTSQTQELQDELNRVRAALDAALNDKAKLLAELQRAPQPAPVAAPTANAGFENIENVETVRTGNTISARVAGDVLFASGKADLRDTAKRTLQQVAAVIQREYPGASVQVIGHSDTDPIRKSKWKDNYHLSEARAEAVRDYLATQGVSSGNMQTIGRGPDEPVAPNTNAAGKAKNRRVEITVLVQQ